MKVVCMDDPQHTSLPAGSSEAEPARSAITVSAFSWMFRLSGWVFAAPSTCVAVRASDGPLQEASSYEKRAEKGDSVPQRGGYIHRTSRQACHAPLLGQRWHRFLFSCYRVPGTPA